MLIERIADLIVANAIRSLDEGRTHSWEELELLTEAVARRDGVRLKDLLIVMNRATNPDDDQWKEIQEELAERMNQGLEFIEQPAIDPRSPAPRPQAFEHSKKKKNATRC